MSEWIDEAEKTHVVLIHETVGESLARDIGTFCLVVGLWSLGYFAGSAALEWLGVLFAMFFILGRAVATLKKATKRRMTPDEARAWLDKTFPPK